MKKVILLIFGCFIAVSCKQNGKQNKSVAALALKSNTMVPIQISLNGYLINDANTMVSNFETGRTTDDNSKTDVWFSKGLIHNIYLALCSEYSDGIRIYFARDANGDNLVIASTRDGGKNTDVPPAPSGANHLDYFEHKEAFLTTAQSNGDIIVDHGPSSSRPSVNGALFYNTTSPCTSTDTCSILPDHDLKCDTAYHWVQNYSLAANDLKNTTSEWFPKKLIEKLDGELQKTSAPDGPDGLRIYFGKRTKDQKLVFVIVTTRPVNNYHQDYYYCFKLDHFKRDNYTNDNGEQCPYACNGVTWP